MKTTAKIKKVGIVLLILIATITIFVPQVLAKQEYLTSLQSAYSKGSCTDCHTDPSGGKSLTTYGSEFKSQSNYKNNPSAAILAIGQPPGNATATSTVVASPSATATNTTVAASPKATTTLTSTPNATNTKISTPNETAVVAATSAAVSTPVVTQTIIKSRKGEKEEEKDEKDEAKETPGFGIAVTIGIVSMVYLLRRYKF